jgi:phenylacetate-CoA ligase
VREIRERAAALIRDTIGCTLAVTLVGPGEAPRSEGGKIERVTDPR